MSVNADANFFKNHQEKVNNFLVSGASFSNAEVQSFCESLREQANINEYDPFNALQHLFCVVLHEHREQKAIKEAVSQAHKNS